MVGNGALPHTPPRPLAKSEVIKLLQGDVPPDQVAQIARERGIAFSITPETEKELRAAGATGDLLETLRALASPPPKPQPGKARGYSRRDCPGHVAN